MAKTKGKAVAATPGTDRPILRSVTGEEPGAGAAPGADGEKVERLSIPLTTDGNAIDWERMRPATREKVQAMLGGGVSPVAGVVMDPAVVGMLYGSLGSLMVGMARARGFTLEQASVLVFTPEEKAALEPCTSKLLAKYTTTLGKWSDEITFCTMFGMVMTGKLSQLKKTAPVIEMVPRDQQAPGEDPAS